MVAVSASAQTLEGIRVLSLNDNYDHIALENREKNVSCLGVAREGEECCRVASHPNPCVLRLFSLSRCVHSQGWQAVSDFNEFNQKVDNGQRNQASGMSWHQKGGF